MNRCTTLLVASLIALGSLAGCTRTSERWEKLQESWPEDRPTGGTPTEFQEFHDGRENFAEMMSAEASAEEH